MRFLWHTVNILRDGRGQMWTLSTFLLFAGRISLLLSCKGCWELHKSRTEFCIFDRRLQSWVSGHSVWHSGFQPWFEMQWMIGSLNIKEPLLRFVPCEHWGNSGFSLGTKVLRFAEQLGHFGKESEKSWWFSKGNPRKFQGNLGWWNIIIWPDYCNLYHIRDIQNRPWMIQWMEIPL